jgi:hypothetical protein
VYATLTDRRADIPSPVKSQNTYPLTPRLEARMIQTKHAPRISKEDRRRNQRFQHNLLGLVDSARMPPADVTEELQEERVPPDAQRRLPASRLLTK